MTKFFCPHCDRWKAKWRMAQAFLLIEWRADWSKRQRKINTGVCRRCRRRGAVLAAVSRHGGAVLVHRLGAKLAEALA